jgi:hypothetical protein
MGNREQAGVFAEYLSNVSASTAVLIAFNIPVRRPAWDWLD